MMAKARLGRIAYLNVLPIYFAMENIFQQNGFHLVRGTPATQRLDAPGRGGPGLYFRPQGYSQALRDIVPARPVPSAPRGRWAACSCSAGCRFPAGRAPHPGQRRLGKQQAFVESPDGWNSLRCSLVPDGQLAGLPLGEAAAVMAIGDEALRFRHGNHALRAGPGAGLAGTHRAALCVRGLGGAPGLCRGQRPRSPTLCTGCCSGPRDWGLGAWRS